MDRWAVIAAIFVSLLTLGACRAGANQLETETPASQTTTTPNVTETSLLDQSRWEDVQAALAVEMLPFQAVEDVLCEWEVLGGAEQEVYVWAVCFGLPAADRPEEYAPRASTPAILSIAGDGSIMGEIPAYGASYAEEVQRLFPSDIQALIFDRMANISDLAAHAVQRRSVPGPPLIVLTVTPQP